MTEWLGFAKARRRPARREGAVESHYDSAGSGVAAGTGRRRGRESGRSSGAGPLERLPSQVFQLGGFSRAGSLCLHPHPHRRRSGRARGPCGAFPGLSGGRRGGIRAGDAGRMAAGDGVAARPELRRPLRGATGGAGGADGGPRARPEPSAPGLPGLSPDQTRNRVRVLHLARRAGGSAGVQGQRLPGTVSRLRPPRAPAGVSGHGEPEARRGDCGLRRLRRLGGDGAHAGGLPGAAARSRLARGTGAGLPSPLALRTAVPGTGPAGPVTQILQRLHGIQLPHHAGRPGESLHHAGGQAVQVVALARAGRADTALVAGHRPHVRPGIQSRLARWLRRRLADFVRRRGALLRPRGALHRRERRPGRPAAVSGRGLPAAHAAELRGDHFRRGLPQAEMAGHAAARGPTDAHAAQPPALSLLGNCINGCDVGAMFNTIAVTLPPAWKTGKLAVRCDSVVSRVRMAEGNRARGVTYIERYSLREVEVDARTVILAGSSLENTRLLLNSAAGGLANSSGVLGHYLMDQISGAGVSGFLPVLKGAAIRNDDGKAGGLYVPNFVNLGRGNGRFLRGYAMSASGGAAQFPVFAADLPGFGSDYKKEVKRLYPAHARVWLSGGEMLARKENFVEIDPQVKDKWGIPVLKIH